jgi:G:T/U-mismatch repair DNA glycosylase
MMSENQLKDGATQTLPPVERHPFTPFLPEGCRLLMLGSFPPGEKRWTMHFYYPNFTNDMWRIFGGFVNVATHLHAALHLDAEHLQVVVVVRAAVLVQRRDVIQLEATREGDQLAAACAVRVGRPDAQPCGL